MTTLDPMAGIDRRVRAFRCRVTVVPIEVEGGSDVAAVVLARRSDG